MATIPPRREPAFAMATSYSSGEYATSTYEIAPEHESAKKPFFEEHQLSHSQNPNPRPSLWSNLLIWWLPELLASILSLCCLASLIVVLRMFEGKPATNLYITQGLTLNGLIAAIATLNRAFLTTPVASAVMQEMWLYFVRESTRKSPRTRLRDLDIYYEAAAGPLGAIAFLGRARGRRVLVYVGCMITILSLAYSTFTQQLVNLVLLPVSGENASLGNLPRCESWEAYDGTSSFNDPNGTIYPTLDMLAAGYSATLGGAVPRLEAYCPSSNCSWPLTPSLAVCGSCMPATFERMNCTASRGLQTDLPGFEDAELCTYVFPGGIHLPMYDYENFTVGHKDNVGVRLAFQVVSDITGNFSNPELFANSGLGVGHFYLFGVPYDSRPGQRLPMAATECALWTCVNVYNGTIRDGIHDEMIVASDSNATLRGERSDIGSADPPSWGFDHDFGPSVDPGNETDFIVSSRAQIALAQLLLSLMNGTVFISGDGLSSATDLTRGAWKAFSDDPDKWVQNIALAMTNVMRTSNTTIPRSQYNGTAYELGAEIRWRWLIVPAALVFSSIFFLLAVMVRTALSPIQSWKGSPLTLLLFNLDEDLKNDAAGSVNENHGVRKAVGDTRVRLTKDRSSGSWTFKRGTPSHDDYRGQDDLELR